MTSFKKKPVLLHALCWVHAERTIHKIVPFTDDQRAAVESIRGKIWNLYYDLKSYKENPKIESKRSFCNVRFVPSGRMETAHRFIGGTVCQEY